MKKKSRPRKPLIVFDWDGVIADSKVIIRVRDKFLRELGYPDEHIIETAKKIAGARSGYNFYSHAELLTRGDKQASSSLADDLYEIMEKHFKGLIFPDARRVISLLKKNKYELDILTAGHAEFQEHKIARSGLRSIFRNIHVVQSGTGVSKYKLKTLKNLALSQDKMIFLDDRADTITTVKSSPSLRDKVLPVLVWRRPENPPKGLQVIQSLSWPEIKKIAINHGFHP